MSGRGLLLLLTAFSAVAMAAEPARIEVFTATRYPIAGSNTHRVAVYVLDLPSAIETELSANLPATLEAAEPLARQALDPHWRTHALALTQAYQGLLKARQYRLAKIPAIVFDGQAVVYGVTEVARALAYYRAAREERR